MKNNEPDQIAILSSSATLVLTNLVELEDSTRADVIEKALYMYAYIHRQIGEDKRLFIVDKDKVIQTEIVFVKPKLEGDQWFKEIIGGD